MLNLFNSGVSLSTDAENTKIPNAGGDQEGSRSVRRPDGPKARRQGDPPAAALQTRQRHEGGRHPTPLSLEEFDVSQIATCRVANNQRSVIAALTKVTGFVRRWQKGYK